MNYTNGRLTPRAQNRQKQHHHLHIKQSIDGHDDIEARPLSFTSERRDNMRHSAKDGLQVI